MAISPRNPTPLQSLIRHLVEAGIALDSLPVQDAAGLARIEVATPRELQRLQQVLQTLGYRVVSSDAASLCVLTLPRAH